MTISTQLKNYSLGHLVAILTLMVSLSACHDDPASPEQPNPGFDNYEGRIREIILTVETEMFQAQGGECSLGILTEDNRVISRECTHTRSAGKSTLSLSTGLKEGDYRLLYIEYPVEAQESEDGSHSPDKRQFGLGCTIAATERGVTVTSTYDPVIEMTGAGTEEDPYIVSSYDHLMKLAHKVNSDLTNNLITPDTHIRQIVDIDMDDASFYTDYRYGWEPIGNDINLPFRGVYHGAALSNIWSLRDHSPAIGLFGYLHKAKIDGVRISRGEFKGNFAVGAVAGAAVTAGASRDRSEITNCLVRDTRITGSEGSLAIGGILGVADMNSKVMLYECHNDNSSISGDYNVGGIIGASSAYSLASLNNCSNSGIIESGFSGAGGIIGTCDTIYATSCNNLGEIRGGIRYQPGDVKNAATGTGGIVGGAGMAFITGCNNIASISGVDGVGGMLGSTRVAGDANTPLYYNNAAFRYCSNYGDVSGNRFVGGICGESQFGSFGVINDGTVSGDSYVAGIIGNSSIAVAHNAVNTGTVKGKDYVAGIVGKCTFGSLALNDNFGEVYATGSHTAGVVGLAGNNTIIHYCGNHNLISNKSGKYIGGIAGEIGDPRKWTGWNIAECVIGSMEIVLSVVGPCISWAEHALEASQHVLSLVLKYSEFAFDMLLHATDVVLWTDGMIDIASGETSEEVSTAIRTATLELANDINQRLASIRTGEGYYQVADALSAAQLYSVRGGFVNNHVDWYAQEGNDDIFNDAINETRFERMEELEKAEETKEIVHQVIGGVCMVAGTVATIAATVATGGAATVFMAAGALIGIVGGVNAIFKCCTEFECNTVIISQCVNSGNMDANEDAGALVGTLQDMSIVRDCLVTGNGYGKEGWFVAHRGTHASVHTSLNVGSGWKSVNIGNNGSAVILKDGNDGYHKDDNVVYAGAAAINDPKTYLAADSGWDIAETSDKRWALSTSTDAGIQYPVPCFSEMRK